MNSEFKGKIAPVTWASRGTDRGYDTRRGYILGKILLFLLLACLTTFPAIAAEGEPETGAASKKEEPTEDQLERKIDEMDAMLDRLERSFKGARKEAQAELKKSIPELRQKEKELRKELDQLRESGQKALKEMEKTLMELRKAIERSQQENRSM